MHVSPCAYWASWCDAVPVLSSRVHSFGEDFLRVMVQVATQTHDVSPHACSRNLHEAAILLQQEGYAGLPTWSNIVQGLSPPQIDALSQEPGEPRKGWQAHATTVRNTHKFANFMNRLSSGDRARLRSCAGPNTGRWLSAIPSEKQLELGCNIF